MNFRKVVLLSGALLAAGITFNSSHAQTSSNVHVLISGLQGPRGLRFGSDGMLYVAEAGTGGKTSTAGTCAQVVPPVGPYKGGSSGRISKVDMSGNRITVAFGLPSSVDAMGDLQGVADVEWLNGTLYALLAGGGCSHGNATMPNAVISVNPKNATWKMVANLSQFVLTHPVKYPNASDFEPDGTFYSMIPYNNKLYVVEPNHGQILSVGTDGVIGSVLDVSASQGHIVPTAIGQRNGAIVLGNLNQFPIEPNYARILSLGYSECSRIRVPGLEDIPNSLQVQSSKAGFTTIVSVAFGPDGLLYVLELSDAAGYPTGGAGKVVRVKADGSIEDVATGLTVPTGMTFGPDGKIYVSNFGAAPAGAGQVVSIDVP